MNEPRSCPACRQAAPPAPACPHCGLALSSGSSASARRATALAVAAAAMLGPAYLLPVMSVERLGHAHADTIFSGVWKLWHQGMWGLALIVFTASLLVPVLKLTGLAFLLAATRWPGLAPVARLERLHAVLHLVGRWSMLDIFLIAFLCGIVRFGGLASIEARPGAVAFACVVVLTMLATAAFDPQILRDAPPSPS